MVDNNSENEDFEDVVTKKPTRRRSINDSEESNDEEEVDFLFIFLILFINYSIFLIDQ